MKFVNPRTEEPVQACFQFEYKGYTVSISNMFGRCEVLAFNSTDQDIPANTVPEVIEKINNIK